MKTKTEQVQDFFAGGKFLEGLRIAKTFRLGLTKEEQAQIVRGYECKVRPDFFLAIKKNPEQEYAKALVVVSTKLLRLL